MRWTSRTPLLGGFTLVELLVVIFIILLISAVTLPTIVPSLNHRRVSEAARILQAALVGARDAAIHYDDPRGIRLIPDATLLQQGIVAANRILAIEPAGDYTEGRVTIHRGWASSIPDPIPTGHLTLYEEPIDPGSGLLNSPTSWYWNIRVGERLRFNDSGRYYTIIGPVVQANSDGFVNVVPPGTREFLWLVNGVDDDQDGYIDPQWDGVDNNLDRATDYLNDPFETEPEDWVGLEKRSPATVSVAYTIERRPVPTQGRARSRCRRGSTST